MNYLLKILQSIDNVITYFFSNLSKEDKYLKKNFKNKNINLVDVGSNLGGYIDFVCKHLNINQVHIFEPSKKCIIFLEKKFKNSNFFINNQAVSNLKKINNFYENEILSQSSLYNLKNKFNSNLKNRDIYKIQCITLDEYFNRYKKLSSIDLLKIDAEGEDLNVLKGSKKLLKLKKIKYIKIELLNSIDKNKKSNINEIIFFLNKYNYLIDTIVKTKFIKNKLLMMDAYFTHRDNY